MSTPTLSDLLSVPDQQTVMDQEVLPELRARGLRVNDWLPGGVYRGLAFLIALLRSYARGAIAALAAAGFEDYAFGFSTPPNGIDVTSWAPLIAKQRYGVDRIEATYTKRKILLTNSVAAPYGPLAAGSIVLAFPSGNRYMLDETTTIPASGSVTALFRSEFATDSTVGRVYNTDSSGLTSIPLVTSSYPGVVASNPVGYFSDPTSVGAGTGTLTLSGTAVAGHSVAVKITSTGTAATAGWSTSLDSLAWAPQTPGVAVTNLGGFGINIALTDNGGNPSFLIGAVYYFSTPGTDLTQSGRDVETSRELGTRCRGLWPSLAFAKDSLGNWIPASPTISAYESLARSVSDQVKICFVTNGAVNNEVLIYVAAQGGLLPSGVLATIQAFFASRSILTDSPVVKQPDTRAITLAGMTITCQSALLAAAKTSLQLVIQNYLGGVDPLVSLSVNGRVDHAYLASLIRRTPGVIKISDGALTINTVAADLQLPVTPGAYEIATWEQQVASVFTWVAA